MSFNNPKCNICGYPGKVVFKYYDAETNRYKTENVDVDCPGHQVMPWQWNRHPDYDTFTNSKLRQMKKSGIAKPAKE